MQKGTQIDTKVFLPIVKASSNTRYDSLRVVAKEKLSLVFYLSLTSQLLNKLQLQNFSGCLFLNINFWADDKQPLSDIRYLLSFGAQ